MRCWIDVVFELCMAEMVDSMMLLLLLFLFGLALLLFWPAFCSWRHGSIPAPGYGRLLTLTLKLEPLAEASVGRREMCGFVQSERVDAETPGYRLQWR